MLTAQVPILGVIPAPIMITIQALADSTIMMAGKHPSNAALVGVDSVRTQLELILSAIPALGTLKTLNTVDHLILSTSLHQLIAVLARLPHSNSNQLKCQHSTIPVQMIQIASVTRVPGMVNTQKVVVLLMPVTSLQLKTVLNAVAMEFVLMEPNIVGIQLVITVSGMINIQKLAGNMMMTTFKQVSFAALVQIQPSILLLLPQRRLCFQL